MLRRIALPPLPRLGAVGRPVLFATTLASLWLLTASASAQVNGVSVDKPIVWTATPNPIACGSRGTISTTIDFKLRGTLMSALAPTGVPVEVELWDDDAALIPIVGGDDYLGAANQLPTLQSPGAGVVRNVQQSFTIDVNCTANCTLEGIAGSSSESAPSVYLYVIESVSARQIINGTSAAGVVQCVNFTAALADAVKSEVAFLDIPDASKEVLVRTIARLQAADDPKRILALAANVRAQVAAMKLPKGAGDRLLQSLESIEVGAKQVTTPAPKQ